VTSVAAPTPTPAPTPSSNAQFAAGTISVAEDAGSVTLTVQRSGDNTQAAIVGFTTGDDSPFVNCITNTQNASSRCDYLTRIDSISFAANVASTTIEIPIIDDLNVEGDEAFRVTLVNPSPGLGIIAPDRITITITDNDTVAPTTNPIDAAPFFVRQQYLDFLFRTPEADGLNAWIGVLNNCSDVNNNPTCDRITVSASFFGSEEFRVKGFFVFRYYRLTLARIPTYNEMVADLASVTALTGDERIAKQAAFANSWLSRPEVAAAFPDSLSPQAFVERLRLTPGVALTNEQQLINDLTGGAKTRSQVLREVAESAEVQQMFFNEAFVAMQYFGYLRRDPEPGGFAAWLNVINTTPNGERIMIDGFLNSVEYRNRFASTQ
ncbi:MAG: Calx-beta domain-containing protein, partial [Pyrinomonadaceae bacterium]